VVMEGLYWDMFSQLRAERDRAHEKQMWMSPHSNIWPVKRFVYILFYFISGVTYYKYILKSLQQVFLETPIKFIYL
jgi:hypothetical protein